MWLLQSSIAWLLAPQIANLLFAALGACAALGASGRSVALATALLYLVLAFAETGLPP